MEIQPRVKEFNVLGQNIRLKESDGSDIVTPREIVDCVMNEANEIKKLSPSLSDNQIAVLVALKIAESKILLEKDYKDNIASLQMTAMDALRLVEEVSPTTH
jgi:cell division protein ZapA (FtsZ GTPase activity inhibitor)